MCHKFFVCACLSSFVVYLWCVVFVVLTVFSLPVSLLLLFLHVLFLLLLIRLFCVWFEFFCVYIYSLIDVLILFMFV